MCFKIKCPGWLDVGADQGTWGEHHSVCLGWPFLPWQKGWAEHLLQCSAQSKNLHSDAQAHVQTFPPKTDYDIIRTSYGNVTMTLGIWNDDIYVSLEGYKKDKCQIERDAKFDFKENRSIPP